MKNMSSHYIYLACSYPGCDTRESIYTGDKYTDDFSSGEWEGETIEARCTIHEDEPNTAPVLPPEIFPGTRAALDGLTILATPAGEQR
jgi:hypothetical protein